MVWYGGQEELGFTACYDDRSLPLATVSSQISKMALRTVIDFAIEFDVGQDLGAPIPQPAKPSYDKW